MLADQNETKRKNKYLISESVMYITDQITDLMTQTPLDLDISIMCKNNCLCH